MSNENTHSLTYARRPLDKGRVVWTAALVAGAGLLAATFVLASVPPRAPSLAAPDRDDPIVALERRVAALEAVVNKDPYGPDRDLVSKVGRLESEVRGLRERVKKLEDKRR